MTTTATGRSQQPIATRSKQTNKQTNKQTRSDRKQSLIVPIGVGSGSSLLQVPIRSYFIRAKDNLDDAALDTVPTLRRCTRRMAFATCACAQRCARTRS